jgi:hypothetical protein
LIGSVALLSVDVVVGVFAMVVAVSNAEMKLGKYR